jgi:hypothetical protein
MINQKFVHHLATLKEKSDLSLGNVYFYDGIQNSSRVDNLGNPKLYTKVVDQVLLSPTVMTRSMFGAKPFEGKVQDIDLDVVSDTQGQWVTGLEELNMSAVSTTVRSSFAHAAFTQPQVSIMLESFANSGSLGIINLDSFKYEKAAAQVVQAIGAAAYGFGQANQILGLEAIVDDGTNNSTIGGISRSTYSQLDSYMVTVTSNKLTLATLDTLHDNIRAAGLTNEKPNIAYTTKAVWSLYGQLLQPFVRQSYREAGYDRLANSMRWAQRSNPELRASAGFDGLTYRTLTIIDDDFGNTGQLYMVNEDYLNWYGRSDVPEDYRDTIEHVSFGDDTTYEGTGALAASEMPSTNHGFFYQPPQQMPTQGGKYARFWTIGNYIASSYRRHGKNKSTSQFTTI